MKKIFYFFVIAALAGGGCGPKDIPPPACASYDACAIKAPASEIQTLKTYLAANNINATEHCSGLHYVIQTAGTGPQPSVCGGVTVQYSGRVSTSTTPFDQTTTEPRTFGLESLIEGWKKGLPLIKQGGKIILYIPPSLGYGSTDRRDAAGNVVIPANSILIFEIQVDRVL